ncbi:MAG TPA: cyanase [Stellaceae bacterium]|jgi:cyanate lyase|nr:cyanase [Stellaceae bacterium]
MNRAEITEKILSAKRLKGLSWKTICAEIGGSSATYLTAGLLGQMKLRPEQAERAAKIFGLGEEETLLLQEVPYRGSLPTLPPSDPLIYRFYELVNVYGTTWKELIQEEFGDGIMSAIDFDMAIERQPDQKGDRVKVTMTGKFLSYKEY